MEMMDGNKCAKGCRRRRGVTGRLSWVLAGQQSAPVGLEWFPPSLENSLKRIDLGKILIDRVFRSNALVAAEVLVSTHWRWWMKTGRLSWVIAGHMSAPVGLEWFPPSLENILKRIDLAKI